MWPDTDSVRQGLTRGWVQSISFLSGAGCVCLPASQTFIQIQQMLTQWTEGWSLPFHETNKGFLPTPINYALSLKCKICPERMAAWLAHNDAYSAAFHQSCCQLKYNRTCSLCPAFVSGLFAALQRIQKHLELLSFSWEEQSCPTAGLHLNNSSFTEVTL